ncbi:MAG: cation:proton antiporter [Candidatus Obscuribacterales bacterium]|nr:cation:proton antiporter [Candidatus Obscuribacterales bacterium]
MTFGLLFLIAVAGLVGPLLSGSRHVSIPKVVGEILAGIIIGASGFELLNPYEPTLAFMSSMGFAMLLFVVGTKLPLRDPELRKALRTGFFATAMSFVVALPIAWLLSTYSSIHNLGLFLLLCVCSSTSTVMPMLHERKLTGRLIVLTTTWIAIADIVSMMILPLIMQTGASSVQIAIGALIVTAVAVGCLIGLKFFRLSDAGEHYRELSKQRGWALDLRLSLAILFGLAWLATSFGGSVLIAGFAAGAVVALIGMPKRFNKQLIGVGEGLFIPLFFVCLGAKLDIWDMFYSWSNIGLMLVVSAATLLVHVIIAKIVRLPAASGMAASAQMGLPAALVSLGLSNGLLTAGQGAALIGAALLSIITSSIGASLLARAPGVEVGTKANDKDNHADPDADKYD